MVVTHAGQLTGESPTVYLSAFAHVLGERTALGDVADETLRLKTPELYDQGLRHCRVSASPVAALAAASARRTLAAAPEVAVGAIVFCTDTPPGQSATSDGWDLAAQLGLPRTPVTVVGGAGCGNLGPGLAVARGLVLLDGMSAVLLVTADRVVVGSRYLAHGQTALSDGAASCLVGSRPHRQAFALEGLAASFRADIGTLAARPIIVARATATGVRSAVRQLLAPLPLATDDFRYLLLGNYGRTAQEFLATSAGIAPARVRCPLLAETGHCFAADALVTLASLRDAGATEPGDPLMLLTASPRSWSVAAVRHVPDGG